MNGVVVDPWVMGGVPCVRGTRVPVVTITGLLAENMSIEAVLEHYPQLTAEDVHACQAFLEQLTRGRSGTPVPGLTLHEVVSQLAWRVLGPLKGRAKSVLDWAGLRGEPPATVEDVARRYFVTPNAVKHRIGRVAAEGAHLPLTDDLLAELVGAPLPPRTRSPTGDAFNCSASDRRTPRAEVGIERLRVHSPAGLASAASGGSHRAPNRDACMAATISAPTSTMPPSMKATPPATVA